MPTQSPCRIVVAICTLNMLLTPSSVHAAVRPDVRGSTSTAGNAQLPSEIVLAKSGTAVGQILDNRGAPQAGQSVTVYHNSAPIVKTVSDRNGRFAVASLRPGVHEVAVGDSRRVVRFWPEDSAPPSAVRRIVVVSGSVVRSQDSCCQDPCCGDPCCQGGTDCTTVGVVAAVVGGVVGGVIGYNLRDHDSRPATP